MIAPHNVSKRSAEKQEEEQMKTYKQKKKPA